MRLEGAALDAADEANKVTPELDPGGDPRVLVFSDDELAVVDCGFATNTFNVFCRWDFRTNARLGFEITVASPSTRRSTRLDCRPADG